MIAGGQERRRVLFRATGPSLPLPGLLGNPMMELRDGNGELLAANDNWRSAQEAEIAATGLAPSHDLEPAIVQTLSYTAILRGVNDATQIAAVEACALSP